MTTAIYILLLTIIIIAAIALGIWYYREVILPVRREQKEREKKDNDKIDFFGEL